jgi:hypothetical protein
MADEHRSAPRIAVIVPVRNGAGALPRLLDALSNQDIDEPWQCVVVDNGSSDGSAGVAAAHELAPHVVREGIPGSYRARNAGILATTAVILAFTDADCAPHAGWLHAGVARIDAGADIVGGRINQALPPRPNAWERYDARHYLDQRHTIEHTGHAATANLFVRRAVFDSAGAFDAELASGGDLEFCYRARSKGYRLAYEELAVVDHRPRRTLRETWELRTRLYAGLHDIERRHPDVASAFHEASRRSPARRGDEDAGRVADLRRKLGLVGPYLVHRLARRVAAVRANRSSD